MTDMLERPTIPDQDTGSLNGCDQYEDPEQDLDDILAALAEEKLSFDAVPYARPYNPHESLTPLAKKKILTSEATTDDEDEGTPLSKDDEGTPLSRFRKHLRETLQVHGHDKEAAEDATVILSELVGNVRLHCVSPGEEYSGECRVKVHKRPYEDELGRTVTRVTTYIEVANFSSNPTSSAQEKKRGEFESGNGLYLVKQLAEAHDGEIGKYRVLKNLSGDEVYVPAGVDCGNFVVWAALRAELPTEPQED